MAPPTNPAADQSDDIPAQRPLTDRAAMDARPATDPEGPTATHQRGSQVAKGAQRSKGSQEAKGRVDPRDAWILAQRPPHWD